VAPSVQILIVDEHDLFRIALASLLASQDDLEVIAQTSSTTTGISVAAQLEPDIVLMDLRLAAADDYAAVHAIIERNPSVRVVALTLLAGESELDSAVAAGVCGCVPKDAPIDDLMAAIHAAGDGAAWLAPRTAQAILDATRGHDHDSYIAAGDGNLGRSEIEVLRLLARGLDNDEIGAALTISARTVQARLTSILNKRAIKVMV
jgi:DNA-binding NarL/FixJ family response regulator